MSRNKPPRSGSPDGIYVQVLAFDKGERTFGTTQFGSWGTESPDRAVARLRYYVHRAVIPMGEVAARAALAWANDRQVAQQVRDVVAAGEMYVHVIADGPVFYEISARPLVFPSINEDRHGALSTGHAEAPRELTRAWSG